MSWTTQPLADAPLEIIDGDRGKNYPNQSQLLDEGFCLFLNAGNVTKDGFAFETCQFVTEEKDNALRKGKAQRQDVLLTTRGTLGNAAYYSESVPFDHIRINSGMVVIRSNPQVLLPRYVYFFMKSSAFQSQVRSLQSGAAQPQLPIRDIKKINISYPELDMQEDIVDVIAAYDDLIENNRRRIALLEETSRLLYREWFVHFRFPGAEHVKIVDGVPEGWERTTIGAFSPFKYGKALKASDRKAGEIPVYGSSGVVGRHNKAFVKTGSIVIGRKGNVGSVFWSDRGFWPIDTVYFVDPEHASLFLYHTLQNVSFINTDVAVPGLNRNMAHSREIVIPERGIFEEFEETAGNFQRQISILGKHSKELAKARDLLLPRLMDGRLEI